MFASLFFISHSNHSSLQVKWDHLSVGAHHWQTNHLQLIHSPQPTLRSHFCMLAFNTTFLQGTRFKISYYWIRGICITYSITEVVPVCFLFWIHVFCVHPVCVLPTGYWGSGFLLMYSYHYHYTSRRRHKWFLCWGLWQGGFSETKIVTRFQQWNIIISIDYCYCRIRILKTKNKDIAKTTGFINKMMFLKRKFSSWGEYSVSFSRNTWEQLVSCVVFGVFSGHTRIIGAMKHISNVESVSFKLLTSDTPLAVPYHSETI